jgi:signal transduction histidine kinase
MEVLNLATAALFDSLKQNQVDHKLLIKGTNLKIEQVFKFKKTHNWTEFVKMYENCALLLGREKTVREIGHLGLYGENISTIRKFGTSIFDAKTIYWGIATFVSKHLFRECVTFKYKKIKSDYIVMEIMIHDDLEDCPLLLETYSHLFENVPTVLGLEKAKVVTTITERKGEYHINLGHSSFFKYIYDRFMKKRKGSRDSIALMAELEDQAIELSKVIEEKSKLLRILTHDISNQSLIIDYYLGNVIRTGELSADDLQALESSNKSSKRLMKILQNVQKMEVSSSRGVSLGPVDLDLIFDSLNNQFGPKLSEKKLILNVSNKIPASVLPIAEASSLEINVLGNLLSNAIKFSNEGGVIELEAVQLTDKVLISIRDQGVGISADVLKNLFSINVKNSSLGTNGEIGTGFGLGIVKNYVDLYEGKISVYPNLPTGTIFTIEIPTKEH